MEKHQTKFDNKDNLNIFLDEKKLEYENSQNAIEFIKNYYETFCDNMGLYNYGCHYCPEESCSANKKIFSIFHQLIDFRNNSILNIEICNLIDILITDYVHKCPSVAEYYFDNFIVDDNINDDNFIVLCKISDTIKDQLIRGSKFGFNNFFIQSVDFVITRDISNIVYYDINKINKIKLMIKHIKYKIPEDIINYIIEYFKAKKIQRWFKNIRYKPSIYPAGERMALRQLEKEGLDDIFN